MDAGYLFATAFTKALCLALLLVARVLPVRYVLGVLALKGPILTLAQDHQRQRHLRLGGSDDFWLPAIFPYPTFDLDIVQIIDQKVRRVGMLRAVFQAYQELTRFIVKVVSSEKQVSRIVGFPARTKVQTQIGAMPSDTIGFIDGFVGTRLTDSRSGEAFTTTEPSAGVASQDRKRLLALFTNYGDRLFANAKRLLCLVRPFRDDQGPAGRTEPELAYVAWLGADFSAASFAIVSSPTRCLSSTVLIGASSSAELSRRIRLEGLAAVKTVV